MNRWITSITVAAVVVTLIWIFGASGALEFSRGGSPLLAMTSNLAHWSFSHLIWDLGAFVLLLLFLSRASTAPLLLMGCALLTSVCAPVISTVAPEIVSYRGLSGIDAMFFVYLGVLLIGQSVRQRDLPFFLVATAALLGFALKVGAEATLGVAFFATELGEGIVPVPVAHVVGAIIGAAGALCETFRVARLPQAPAYNSCLP